MFRCPFSLTPGHFRLYFLVSVSVGFPQPSSTTLTVTTFPPHYSESPSGTIFLIGLPAFSLSESSRTQYSRDLTALFQANAALFSLTLLPLASPKKPRFLFMQ